MATTSRKHVVLNNFTNFNCINFRNSSVVDGQIVFECPFNVKVSFVAFFAGVSGRVQVEQRPPRVHPALQSHQAL